MKRALRVTLLVLALLLLIVLVGPFLVPIPPLKDTVPPEELADPESHFVEVNGLRVHYKVAGQGQTTFILLHGFGASVYSWHKVMQPLSQYGTVVAYDRPAFGLTERPVPPWAGENPYSLDANVELLLGLMDRMGIDKAVLVGNSAGGTVAVAAALRHPERVQALVLVDAAIYAGAPTSSLLRWVMRTPQAHHLGPLLVRSIQSRGLDILVTAWHDPTQITAEDRAGYTKPLRAQDWDRALWEFTLAQNSREDLASQLANLQLPTLVITGDDDRIVPTEQSLRLAGDIPRAQLVVVPGCGHVPHEERPEEFMRAVEGFVASPKSQVTSPKSPVASDKSPVASHQCKSPVPSRQSPVKPKN